MLWILLHLKKFTFLVCPPGLSVFSLPFKTGQKRLLYFPEALLFVLVLLVVSFFFSAEMFRIFKEKWTCGVLGSCFKWKDDDF